MNQELGLRDRALAVVVRLWAGALGRAQRAETAARERGDVPGWVLITIMTAGIVVVLWGVAQGLLTDLFRGAVSGVTGPKG